MLRRTFLKLSCAVVAAPALPVINDNNWNSLLLSEWRPWEPPKYHIGQTLTNRVTGVKMVCVDVSKGDTYWKDLKAQYA